MTERETVNVAMGAETIECPGEIGLDRNADGAAHHFLTPVFIEAGRQEAFALQCGLFSSACDVQVTRGDRYAGGGIVFRPNPGKTAPQPAPSDADLPFETWVIEAGDP